MKTPKKRTTTKRASASPGKKTVKVEEAVTREVEQESVVATPVLETPFVPAQPVDVPTPAVAAGSAEPVLVIKSVARLVLVALLLGLIFDFLFWEQAAGVNFALFLTLSLMGGLFVLIPAGHTPARNALWLLIPFALFAVVTFLRQETLTVFLAYTFTLVAVGLLATSYLGGRWYLYRLSDYLRKFVLLLADLMIQPLLFIGAVRRDAKLSQEKPVFPVAGVFRGLVIALPIVLCFGSLLASADVVFSQKLDDLFDSEKIFEYIQRTFLVVFLAYVLAAAFLHAATRSRDERVTVEDKPVIKPFLGFTEATVVLGSVALLFLLFVIVQFQYFFGGETNIGVTGYTYSQYARRGFNELVTVAFFSLVLILGLSTLTRRDEESQKKVYSGLSAAVVALVMVILVSAYQRISLAIDWHGFSRLRLYPRVFLIWLGILLVVVALLELIRRERYFGLAAVLASIGFALSLTAVNVDAAIVRHNVARSLDGRHLNVAHLASLSVDAVPALVDEFSSDAYSLSDHEGIGAALLCYLQRDTYDEDPAMSDWRSFNLSRWRAHLALQQVESQLQEFGIDADGPYDRNWKVRTPSNVWYRCRYVETGRAE